MAETKKLLTPDRDRFVVEKRTSHIRWVLVIWMFIVSVITYLYRIKISIAGIGPT